MRWHWDREREGMLGAKGTMLPKLLGFQPSSGGG